jgi:hypothetical protein
MEFTRNKVLQRIDFDCRSFPGHAFADGRDCARTRLFRFHVADCATPSVPPITEIHSPMRGGWMQEMVIWGVLNRFLDTCIEREGLPSVFGLMCCLGGKHPDVIFSAAFQTQPAPRL